MHELKCACVCSTFRFKAKLPFMTSTMQVAFTCSCSSLRSNILYTPYISRGFYFRASRVLFANLSTRENIYLRSRRMNATCVRNTLLSSIANLTTRENVLKSRFAKNYTREIYGVYSTSWIKLFSVYAKYVFLSNYSYNRTWGIWKHIPQGVGFNVFVCLLAMNKGTGKVCVYVSTICSTCMSSSSHPANVLWDWTEHIVQYDTHKHHTIIQLQIL